MTVPSSSASCPFCRIAAAYPPIPPSTFHPRQKYDGAHGSDIIPTDPTQETHAHLVLSTPYVLAFLDIMPLTRGHVLLVTRNHYEKLKDMGVEVSREVSISSNLLPRGLHEQNPKGCGRADRPVAPYHLAGRDENRLWHGGRIRLELEYSAE
jgi:diadenosine tetraphosphate (Ap4A) HIT family hydrolase